MVVSRPVIQAHITNGSAIITGLATSRDADNLRDQIKAGQFPARPLLLEAGMIVRPNGDR